MRHVSLCVLAAFGGASPAQSNVVAGVAADLTSVDAPVALGRRGAAHPGGEVAIGFGHSVCNVGAAPIAWRAAGPGPAPMAVNHPLVAFLVAREANGRMMQITDDAAFVRHAAGPANAATCGVCVPGLPDELAVGCADSTDAAGNGDRYWLGPMAEVQPWLGTWTAVGSYFDQGDPAVSFPANQDGVRSLTSGGFADAVKNRLAVAEADLLAGGRYYYQAHLLVPGEDADDRYDNLRHREMTPNWGGSAWTFVDGPASRIGSVLDSWQGATVCAARNGDDDGELCVGVRTDGPVAGLHHYEYAVHNIDNARGAATLRIPVCSSTVVTNIGFRDIDGDPLDDWNWTRTDDELVFQAGVGNALSWNRIYNFWFDCDAAPTAGEVELDQALPGPGSGSVTVPSRVPAGTAEVRDLGPACSPTAPIVSAPMPPVFGDLAYAVAMDAAPGAAVALFASLDTTNQPFLGCTQYLSPVTMIAPRLYFMDATGHAAAPFPLPNLPAFDGMGVHWQAASLPPAPASIELSNGLTTQVGCRGDVPRVLQFTGFETGDLGEFFFAAPGASVGNTFTRSGDFAFHSQAILGDEYAHATMNGIGPDGVADESLDVTDLYISFWFRFENATGRSRIAEVGGTSGATKCRLELEVDRRLSINDWLHTNRFLSTNALQPSRWYRIRWYVGTGTVARCIVMVDENVEIDRPDATFSDERSYRFHIGRSSRSGGIMDLWYDDLILSTGGFTADGRVAMLLPTGSGQRSGWSGTHADLEQWPHDGDLTTASPAGIGSAATYAMTDTAALGIGKDVLAVKPLGVLRRPAGSGRTALRLRSGAVEVDTAAAEDGTIWSIRNAVFPLDPATGRPWTRIGVDALEVGFLETAGTGSQATSVGAQILYLPQ